MFNKIKEFLRTIGIILVMPTCMLIFLVAWPLYVLFDGSAVYVYDDDDVMPSGLYQEQQEDDD
jgi:hypothetical protein